MTSKLSVSLSPRLTVVAVSFFLLIAWAANPTALQDQTRKVVPVVAPAALEPLLPGALEGWTNGSVTSYRVTDGCVYSFAASIFRKGEDKLRITVADTGFDADALMTVATIVLSFPAGHTETIPPDTAINRITYRDWPAATMWTASKHEGEFTVVVDNRFVAKVEGTSTGGLDTLRGVLDQIDLKKLAALAR
jgi:hypothetical protein